MDSNKVNLVQEVNDNAWIIGGAMISRHDSKPSQPYWEDGEGAFFTMAEAPSPRPPVRPLSNSCPITDVFKGWSWRHFGVYKIGLAHFKVTLNIGSQEHNTLDAVAKRSYGFMIPTVYCHGVYGDFYHIVHSILPGKTIAEVWPTTKDDALRTKWTQQIGEVYHELSKWPGDHICGVDGGNLKDRWATYRDWSDPRETDPEVLRKNFEDMGLDCSNIVFAHNYMMPLSFTVDESQGLLGITMWSAAGFVPKDWVRTMTRSNAFTESAEAIRATWPEEDLDDWEAKIEAALMERGFREFWYGQAMWRSNKLQVLKEE